MKSPHVIHTTARTREASFSVLAGKRFPASALLKHEKTLELIRQRCDLGVRVSVVVDPRDGASQESQPNAVAIIATLVAVDNLSPESDLVF